MAGALYGGSICLMSTLKKPANAPCHVIIHVASKNIIMSHVDFAHPNCLILPRVTDKTYAILLHKTSHTNIIYTCTSIQSHARKGPMVLLNLLLSYCIVLYNAGALVREIYLGTLQSFVFILVVFLSRIRQKTLPILFLTRPL